MNGKNSYRYWTLERCKTIAKKFKTRVELTNKYPGVIDAIYRHGWKHLLKHMSSPMKPHGHWTKEACSKEAKKYKTRTEFMLSSTGYYAAHKKGWIDDCCKHMGKPRMKKGYWTKKRVLSELKIHGSKSALMKANGSAYDAGRKNRWFNVKSRKNQPVGFWTYKNCKKEAKKYQDRTTFRKQSAYAYKISNLNGWLDEICKHMPFKGNKYYRMVYVQLFVDKTAYIGLTCNPNDRKHAHITRPTESVRKYMDKSGLDPKFKPLTDFVIWNEAQVWEEYYKNKYLKNGYTVLNKAKTGGLGGRIFKHSESGCLKEAQKYKTRTEFQKCGLAYYRAAYSHGWLEKCCSHMIYPIKDSGYWLIKKNCLKAAKKCKTRKEFQQKYSRACAVAREKGWFEECCEHMPVLWIEKWGLKECREEAKKYNTRSEFSNGSPGAYDACLNNKWLDKVCSHMFRKNKPNGYWTIQRAKTAARKFKTLVELRKGNGAAYKAIYKNNWFELCCSHMPPPQKSKPAGYWNIKSHCLKEAKKYRKRIEFQKLSNSAYNACRKNGWLDECCTHMKEIKKPNGYWTLQKVKREAKKYKSRSGFNKGNSAAYQAGWINGWIDECCKHMKKK